MLVPTWRLPRPHLLPCLKQVTAGYLFALFLFLLTFCVLDIFEELLPTYADLIKDIPSSQSIRDMLHHYASQAHLAGSHQDHQLAKWTCDQFTKFGLKNATIETYYPFMNYPTERKLGIVTGNPDLLFLADLQESKDSTPTFHGKLLMCRFDCI